MQPSSKMPPRISQLLTALSLTLCLAANVHARADPPTPVQGDDPPAVEPAPPPDDPDIAVTYWRQQREGWFWYRDPAPAKPKAPLARKQRPKDLDNFEAMQKRLEDLKRIAVMNPSDTNLLVYMRMQRMVMDKSQVFADRWQRLVWREPDLDYATTGRPTNALAINVFDDQQRDRDAQTVRSLASTYGLIFVFRSDCPFCHRFAPILKRFSQEFGLTVLPVSMDGGTLPEYPDARPDNGIATRLQARSVPALYLTQPSRREIRPVGFGLMSDTELLERVATIARDRADSQSGPGRTQR